MIPLTPGSNIYFIGICGTGMSNLARYFHAQGFHVTGSDAALGFYTAELLEEAGIGLYEGFDPSRISRVQPDAVIYSAAFSEDTNEELARTVHLAVPAASYPEVLGFISRQLPTICIAGTHGKTTTSYMTLLGLQYLGVAAAPLIGAPFPILEKSPAAAVIEACEYRWHFLRYRPAVSVITSLDYDHVDCYPTRESYREAFESFAQLTTGELILHGEAALDTASYTCRVTRYGRDQIEPFGTLRRFLPWGLTAKPGVPGMHIAEDALAALQAVRAWWLHVHQQELDLLQLQGVLDAICSYRGTSRRFEQLGEFGGVLFIDDYAHHPAEINALLEGIREAYPARRLVVDFVPHTVSRTRAFLDQFVQALSRADVLILQEIYLSQREMDSTDPLSSRDLADRIPGARYCRDGQEAFQVINGLLQEGDLCITMGAGDNRDVGRALAAARKGERA